MHRSVAMILASILWLTIGSLLLVKGLNMVNVLATWQAHAPLLSWFYQHQQKEMHAPLMLVFLGVFLGFIKGNTVFRKMVRKNVYRLKQMQRVKVMQIFPRATWIIMASMMFLGFLFKLLPIPLDVRAVILIAVGSALIQGAIFYLRCLVETHQRA
ncbi:MAG: hypothetical protein HY860_04510 [Chlamydiales bacterium]|nr:hypothetical protein [Chlamydiales bacterium]